MKEQKITGTTAKIPAPTAGITACEAKRGGQWA